MSLDCQWQLDWLWLHLEDQVQPWHELQALAGPGGHPQLQTGLEWQLEWLAGCSLHGQLLHSNPLQRNQHISHTRTQSLRRQKQADLTPMFSHLFTPNNTSG